VIDLNIAMGKKRAFKISNAIETQTGFIDFLPSRIKFMHIMTFFFKKKGNSFNRGDH